MKKVIPGKIKTQLRLDGYYNVLNKYGTQHDSTEYYQWASGSAVSDTELADLYAGNGLFSTIIDAPADDATKNGIDLGIKDKDLQKQLDNHLQTIRYQSKFAKALRWARLFGGAAVVMLVDDGRLLQDPLNWRDVHGVEELLVYGRNEMYPLWVNGYENNPDDEDYRRGGTGIPEYYQVNSVYGNYVVHSSRCLVFHNSDIPESSTMANLYRTWGIPEYLRIREELRNASIGPGYSIRLLERLSMVTYKMKNLAGVLSTADGEDTVLQRMEMLDLARNLLNMVIIDADGEDVGVQSLSVAGVKDILDNACAMLSAVSHIPQTRLFGRSPAGENATGESDLENYKEFVGGLQNGDLRDNTRTLVELILRGMVWNREVEEIPEYTVTYKSAWSPSDDEKAAQDQAAAAAQLTRAQTAGTYVTNGIVEAEEVRRAMVRDEQFDPENILTEADIHQDWGLGGADTQQEAADGQQQNVADASGLVTDEGDCGYVAGFVVQDGKILCGRRSDGQGWCGPGGHIEPKETPGVAFRREAKEEFGIDVGNITYAASDITSGNLPIERGGTGAGTAADACRALGAMRNTGGTFTGTVYFANGTMHYVGSAGDAHFRSMTASEDIHAKRVFEAVYNDYAELMPRGEDTEPGDIIALDTNSQQEKYAKATNLSSRIAGIHSDEYGMLIGGEQVNDGEDFLEKNLPLFIPVSLAGRVHTKVIGPVNTGDCIVLSHIPGVGRAAKPCEYVDPCKVVGYAVEGDDLTEQRRLKVRVRGA